MEAILNFTVEFLIWATRSKWSIAGLVVAVILSCLFWYGFPEMPHLERWTVFVLTVTFLAVIAARTIWEQQTYEEN